MKLFCLTIILAGLISCSTSSVKYDKSIKIVTRKVEKPFSINVIFESDVEKEELAYWEGFFIQGLKYGIGAVLRDGEVNPRVLISKNSVKCKIRVRYKDDQDSFGSWKTWVSGMSLGLIPIKFIAEYHVSIANSKGKSQQYENTIETWRHTIIFPLIFLATSKQHATTVIGDEVYRVSREYCGKL